MNYGIKENFEYLKKHIFKIIFILPLLIIIIQYHFKVSGEGLPLYGSKGNFFESVILSIFNTFGFTKTFSIIVSVALLWLNVK